MALSMVPIATNGFCRSYQAVLGGSLQLFCMPGSSKRLSMGKAGFAIRAHQVSSENETSRRSMLVGLAAAGLASGSFVQPVLAAEADQEAKIAVVPGGYQPFPMSSFVIALAAFAVAEHNMKAVVKLELVEVHCAEFEVVAVGTNYKLVINAKDVGMDFARYYEAIVFKSLNCEFKLVSFRPLVF